MTGVAALAGTVALAAAVRGPLALGDAYVPTAAAGLAVVLAVMLAGIGSHPQARFGAANRVTLGRAALVSLLAAAIAQQPSPALGAAIAATSLVAALLDGVDGWLARRSGTASRFGARFDMEIDALLILVLSVLVWRHGRAGMWILLAGLLRYLFVAAGWLLPWLRKPLPPSVRRQAICVVQIGGLILAMAPFVPRETGVAAAAISLAALAGSFAVDTAWLARSDRGEQVA